MSSVSKLATSKKPRLERRSLGFAVLALVAASQLGSVQLHAEETTSQRVARIKAMANAEKQELAQKKKRYDELPSAEQDRIRNLHAALEARPDSLELTQVMQHYHEWLKTLSANQLADLRALPEEKRVEQINRILAEQQQKAWRKLAEQASPDDLEAVFSWLRDFVVRHQAQLSPGEYGRRLAAIENERRTLILIYIMNSSRFPGALRPNKGDIEQLIPRLSPNAQKLFNETDDSKRQLHLISIWSRAAWWSKAFPNVTSEELANFFDKLPAEERDRLERMPATERDAEIRLLYARLNFFRRGELPWEGRDNNRGPRRPGPR